MVSGVTETASLKTLTAVNFIGTVPTVIIGVTEPDVWDAAVVGTGELTGRAGPRSMCRAVVFIAVIKTVVVPIAAPPRRHTSLIGTGERRRGTSGV